MGNLRYYRWLHFMLMLIQVLFSDAMHFHHSNYKVHHKMGKMKIKVKPEGAKLVFLGGDLDVELHPAHGYVRPIHNVIVSHSHEEHHEEPIVHHGIEHEEEEDHSGHHEYHHSYHHDEHGGHDDDGYGFRHFNRWPNSLHGEHSFLGHNFYHDHHGDHHGHFRDEIRDGNDNEDHHDNEDEHESEDHHEDMNHHESEDHEPDRDSEDNAESRHKIVGNEDRKEEELHRGIEEERRGNDDVMGQSRDRTMYEKIQDRRNDAVIYGKKIYPDDVAAPTHKSNIEDSISKFSSKIAPGAGKKKEDDSDDVGSARGTISPFDDDNDQGGEKTEGEGRNLRLHEQMEHSKPKIDIKELEQMASKLRPDIPEEDEIRLKESERNEKDIGKPSQVYVNMSGEPHNYGDEGKQEDYPGQNREFGSNERNEGDTEESQRRGDYYPYRESEEGHWGRPENDNEDEEVESFKKSFNEFQKKAKKIQQISNELAGKKDISPPVLRHPDGDPRGGDSRKAFYEYNPTVKLAQHMATINDFNVRNKIAKKIRLALIKKSIMGRVLRNKNI